MRCRDPLAALLFLLAAACDSNAPGASASLELAGASHAFGSVAVGGQSQLRRFTLSNTGDGPTGELAAALSGQNSAEFAIVGDGCSGNALSAATTCTLDVQLRPTALGTKSATLEVRDRGANSASIALSGSATAAGISMASPSHDFGPTSMSTSSAPFVFVVYNTGQIAVGPLQSAVSGAYAGQFEISSDSCDGVTLAPSATCGVTVSFRPSAAGAISAALTVSDAADASATATLRGQGGTAITLAIAPAAHDFGVAAPGSVVSVSVTNQSAVTGSRLSARLAGTNASDFSISADGCTNRELAPGQSCPMQVAFVRQQPGEVTATLEVVDLFGAVGSMTLRGTGTGIPVLTAAPSPLSFGSVSIGASSAAKSVTITNTGAAPSGALTTSVLDCSYYYYYCSDSPDFAIANDGCAGVQLQPGGSCAISVAFKPTFRGSVSHVLSVAGTNVSVSISLLGQGTGITVTPELVVFPGTPRGSSSDVQHVIVLNGGTAATGPLTTVIEPSGFAIVTDACTGTGLAPGTTCTITIRFAPSNTGEHAGQLIVSGDPGGSAFTTLRGLATP